MPDFETDLQKYIHISKYARWIEKENRRETWKESVKRFIDFWKNQTIGGDAINDALVDPEILGEIEKAILRCDIMPSMRGMMTAGKALERDHIAGFNCTTCAVTHPAIFSEAFYILMNGCGFGFSVERQYINKLPEVAEQLYETETTLSIRDSKIGWATGLKELVSMLYNGQIPKWDLSKVRPAGSRLKTFGGRASGSGPLNNLFNNTVNLFKNASGRKLTSIECHDLMCYIADTVIVGSVRRSALISLSNLSDHRMRRAKDGSWWTIAPHRALANNSVAYTEKPDLDSFSKEWRSLYKSKSGERGIWNKEGAKKLAIKQGRKNAEDYEYLTNPCFTGDMRLKTVDGYKTFESLSGTEPYIINKNRNKVKSKVWCSGVKHVIQLNFKNRDPIKCTPDHVLMDVDGNEIEAKDSNGVQLLPDDVNDIDNTIVSSIDHIGTAKVYDFSEPETNWGIVEGLFVHNCGETILRDDGSICNLSEVIIRPDDSLNQIKKKIRLATIMGTLQATLTNFRFLRKVWKKNAEEERLLGVSLTGIMDHVIFNNNADSDYYHEWSGGKATCIEELLKYLHDYAHGVNKRWAKNIGIDNTPHICLCKPSGTVSILTGTSSGIHPRYGKFYIRRVRNDKKDPVSDLMISEGVPYVDEGDKYVFSFYIKSPEHSVIQKDIGAMQQLELWKIYKKYWCDGNPSQTIYYNDDDYFAIADWLWKNWDTVGGLSFFPYTNSSDGVYVNAPLEEITEDEYNKAVESFPKNIKWDRLVKYEHTDTTESAQTLACSGGNCEI